MPEPCCGMPGLLPPPVDPPTGSRGAAPGRPRARRPGTVGHAVDAVAGIGTAVMLASLMVLGAAIAGSSAVAEPPTVTVTYDR